MRLAAALVLGMLLGALAIDRFGREIRRAEPDPVTRAAAVVLEPGALDFIEGDSSQFERGPLQSLAGAGELMAYRHEGFWQCMDTLRDKRLLQELCDSGDAPWMTWRRDRPRPATLPSSPGR